MYCTMASEIHFQIRLVMIPFLFCFYNDEPIFFSENGAQVFRDLVDALKTLLLCAIIVLCQLRNDNVNLATI